MGLVTFAEGRQALTFGEQKINLHQQGSEFVPKAGNAMPGSADLCFIVDTPVLEVRRQLGNRVVDILEGPVQHNGACGEIVSVYIRDPDANLIEISNYL